MAFHRITQNLNALQETQKCNACRKPGTSRAPVFFKLALENCRLQEHRPGLNEVFLGDLEH